MTETASLDRTAWGWGLATVHATAGVLDTYYPAPALGRPHGEDAPGELTAAQHHDETRDVHTEVVCTAIDLDTPPASTPDAYLRLHLLSHRLAAPRTINLDGIFTRLPNVVWTSIGPCAVEGFELVRSRLRARHGSVTVYGVDKFPRMVDYVLPSGVRIADADRVRLGAHLAAGTTVMHEGFVNFNAGTLGTLDGRGPDLLPGSSSAATPTSAAGRRSWARLSGGGNQVISVGERCLLGANAGIGIALGDDCVVEAGLYVTAATKVTLPDGDVVKALTLSGQSGLLFLRNSVSGAIEVRRRAGTGVELNPDLHQN